MARTICNNMKSRGVLLDSVAYDPLPKNTKIQMNENMVLYFEQKGKKVGRYACDLNSSKSKTERLSECAREAKQSFLFKKYKGMKIHYLSMAWFSINKAYEGKSASGGQAYYTDRITCYINKIDMDKFAKWCKDNNFKKKGNVWLEVGQAQNLIGNLLLEKGFASVISQRSLPANYKIRAGQDTSLLSEVKEFVNRNVERWGMNVVIMFTSI